MSDISKISEIARKELATITKAPSVETEMERDQLHNEKLSLENKSLKGQIANDEQDREERKKYASFIFWLLAAWLLSIMAIIYLSGFRLMTLSDTILVTIITTTTANVAAYFLLVTKYLFPKQNR